LPRHQELICIATQAPTIAATKQRRMCAELDLSSKSDTERAASVWNAALPRKSVPDIDTLAELGRKLNWIKTWYLVDIGVTSGARDKIMTKETKEMEVLSKRLVDILSNDCHRGNLFRHYQGGLDEGYPYNFEEVCSPSLDELISGLQLLPDAAQKIAAEIKRKSSRKSPKGNSPLDRFIFQLADCYERFAGKQAGASVQTLDNRIGGPFVRFVQETVRQFSVPEPSGSAIRAALIKRRTGKMEKHVIGVLIRPIR
jgi:hypothetical protein